MAGHKVQPPISGYNSDDEIIGKGYRPTPPKPSIPAKPVPEKQENEGGVLPAKNPERPPPEACFSIVADGSSALPSGEASAYNIPRKRQKVSKTSSGLRRNSQPKLATALPVSVYNAKSKWLSLGPECGSSA